MRFLSLIVLIVGLGNQAMTQEFIVIDTEFIRENTFYPKLCLIQISNGVKTLSTLKQPKSTTKHYA